MGPKKTPQYYVSPDGFIQHQTNFHRLLGKEKIQIAYLIVEQTGHIATKTVINYIILSISLLKILIEVQALIIFNQMYLFIIINILNFPDMIV